MKTFIFSILMLLLLITVIFFNAHYVKDVTTNMQDGLEALPTCAQANEQAQALFSYWQAQEKRLELSVPATDMNDVSNRLTELCVATQAKDKEAFEQARALCLLGLMRIQEFERFSFLHIL